MISASAQRASCHVALARCPGRRLSTARLNRFVEKLALRCVGSGGTEAALQRIKYMVQVGPGR